MGIHMGTVAAGRNGYTVEAAGKRAGGNGMRARTCVSLQSFSLPIQSVRRNVSVSEGVSAADIVVLVRSCLSLPGRSLCFSLLCVWCELLARRVTWVRRVP